MFPAGTVSGAPKVRAIQLVYELDQEKRGVYAGAAGWFGYDALHLNKVERDGGDGLVLDATLVEGPMDTCIAIRTMLINNGNAYLQAGGGVVYDSGETEEWMETMNKLAANLHCLELAEKRFQGKINIQSVRELIAE